MARRKRPKETRLEVRALTLRPAAAARRDEIVEEIVDQLRPWKEGEAKVIELVQNDLHYLLLLAPLEARRCSDRTVNRVHAQKLDRVLLSMEELLATAPIPLRQFLLDPIPTMTADGVIWPTDPPSLQEQIERKNKECADSFRSEVKRMREVGSRAINDGLGHHPNYDPVKHFCAMFAHGLMEGLSERTITSTKDSAFRAIASLLYEAISENRDADLKRACDAGFVRLEPGTDRRFKMSPVRTDSITSHQLGAGRGS